MQNTKNHSQQMKQLVYTMESAIAMKPKESRDRMSRPVRTPPTSSSSCYLTSRAHAEERLLQDQS